MRKRFYKSLKEKALCGGFVQTIAQVFLRFFLLEVDEEIIMSVSKTGILMRERTMKTIYGVCKHEAFYTML